ncbi:23S rRNA (guanosine(2251)-2'-O)-methyltransferase RlmB [Helicobacter anseris]|uniref:23S rRNA (Guanosine(2251)-2'-O)-methyltransferase RlmB n=1 Tax=Helicobacter anseris TaxID=375926 RepID=A0A3D8J5N0_9HELI|nr:23S rRNA (guanosine(2251)-2'-O)-methyltransferase RlmB [Helicobacter anseris]RDU72799.1 23S rRNA (guanosine(2251)-2'-O)-methyltransferase RlmB [Helicobacter anseris]
MIVFGKQSVCYILEYAPHLIEEIYFSKEIDKKLFSKFSKLSKPIIRLDNKKAQSLAKGGNHQGFFLKIASLEQSSFKEIKSMRKILVLCGITDTGNIGSIFRSAYCLGIEAIVLSGIKSFSIEGVLRSSVGAILQVPFCIFENPLDVINELRNEKFFLYGADMSGKDISQCNIADKYALFLGSEGSGLGGKILSKLDTILSIRMHNSFNSLNVAVAAGILMHRM